MPEHELNTSDCVNIAGPLRWCPGCGHGIVMKAAIRAIDRLKIAKNDIVAATGIGCAAYTPGYLDLYGIQTTHGRAIPFTTGIKMVRPEMKIILFLGDGDCIAIGGNHFIHGAARNIDLTVVVMNNRIYGMTGGQNSPTAPAGTFSATAPFGKVEREINICDIAVAAGATFVARTTAYHVNQLASFIERGMKNKGFSVIDCITPCPTGYGRANKMGRAVDMYRHLKDAVLTVDKAGQMTEEELEGRIITGVLKDAGRPEFVDEYQKTCCQGGTDAEGEDIELIASSTAADYPQRLEVSLCGSGGQGLILAGIVAADAAIRQGKNAVHSQSYGPEARGGASRSEVIVSEGTVYYPEVTSPDILLAMTQESCDKYASRVKPGGVLLLDSTYIDSMPQVSARLYRYPITKLAIDKCGNALVANVVALGMLCRITGFLSLEALEKAVLARVPAAVKELNIKALAAGYDFADYSEEGSNK